jgi:hypothetical protein
MLSPEQRQFYEQNGYLYPLRVFNDNETAAFRRQFDQYTDQNKDRLSKLIPRERRAVYGLTHLMLPWVCGRRRDRPQPSGVGIGLVR